MTPQYKEGEKIHFRRKQEPVEGDAILASFSFAQCLTPCPHGEASNVGSLGCTRCKYYGGRWAYAVATGHSGLYGTTDMRQKIYCKRKKVENETEESESD